MNTKSTHLFQPGNTVGAAGRPKGSVTGRSKALKMLDEVLGEEDVQRAMKAALRQFFLDSPVKAFRRLVLPLLPRQMKLDVAEPITIVWKSLLTQPPPAAPLPSPDGTDGETP